MNKALIDRFKKHMVKNNIKPPDEIIDDGRLHTYPDGDGQGWYSLDSNKPAAGLYGVVGDESTISKWAQRRESSDEETLYAEKIRSMKKQVKKKLTALCQQVASDSAIPGSGHSEECGSNESCNLTVEATVNRLATMSPVEYDRTRKGEASALSIRVSTLDKMVLGAQKSRKNSLKPGCRGRRNTIVDESMQLEFGL
jgi:hypothetical protein